MRKSNHPRISTKRLDLEAATEEHISAELESPERLGILLKAKVEPGWPPGEYDRGAQKFFREQLRKGGETVVGWNVWYASRREPVEQPILIGAGGYVCPPNKIGEVEIGFSIVKTWRGQGYATEFAKALVEWAFEDCRVRKIIANTTIQNQASCKVLKKTGFQCPDNGEKTGNIRFEITREQLRKAGKQKTED
jgi:RimJ/RimL family protein N-acetyltransferase